VARSFSLLIFCEEILVMRICNRSVRFLTLLIAVSAIGVAAKADTLYSDGPIDGTYSSWTINFGFQVEDSFTLSSASTLTGATFGNWLIGGDTASSVDWAIVGSEGSQTPVCGGCSGTASLTAGATFLNSFGYDVVDQGFSLGSLNLGAGTYWLELQNLVTNNGDPGFWDMNGGPSSIWENTLGDQSGANCTSGAGPGTCSDSFTIMGTTTTGATPEPGSLALLFSGVTLIGAESSNPSPFTLAPIGRETHARSSVDLSRGPLARFICSPLLSYSPHIVRDL
jgi:hypothetical protein